MKFLSKLSQLAPRAPRASARLALLAALLFPAAHAARAQDVEDDAAPAPQQEQEAPPLRRARRPAPNLLGLLNLTPEQVGRIREIRRTSEPEARALARRLALTRRALNQAIYSDAADETTVSERARELAEAQSEATRLRAQVEWRVRNVLTPEQLGKLRELRAEAQRGRRLERLRDRDNPRRPLRRLRRPPEQ